MIKDNLPSDMGIILEQIIKKEIEHKVMDWFSYSKDTVIKKLFMFGNEKNMIDTLKILIRKEFDNAFKTENIDAKINSMIIKFDKNLSKMVVDVNKRMDKLEQDLLETIRALKKYMEK
jgi:hypothetical protein